MAKPNRYDRKQSRLFRITSRRMLAERLLVSTDDLDWLARHDNYKRWFDKDSGRDIQEPKERLALIHNRVNKLLSRIETPDFLHSATKGRSYLTNASQHSPNLPAVKVDIKKFYPNARVQAVYHFFADRMECEPDVASILAKLLTVDGHLATGSSVSPILSYFAYEDMFLEIEALAIGRGCTMTCYVDDMVITGKGATPKLIREITAVAKRYRLWIHKTKAFQAFEPRVVTGVAVTTSGNRVPNKRQARIQEDIRTWRQDPVSIALTHLRRLVGRLHEAASIDPRWGERAREASRHLKQREKAV